MSNRGKGPLPQEVTKMDTMELMRDISVRKGHCRILWQMVTSLARVPLAWKVKST